MFTTLITGQKNESTVSASSGPALTLTLTLKPFSQQATADDQHTVRSNVPNRSTTDYKYIHNGL